MSHGQEWRSFNHGLTLSILSSYPPGVALPAGLEWRVFTSACLPNRFSDQWRFGGLTYHLRGAQDFFVFWLAKASFIYDSTHEHITF